MTNHLFSRKSEYQSCLKLQVKHVTEENRIKSGHSGLKRVNRYGAGMAPVCRPVYGAGDPDSEKRHSFDRFNYFSNEQIIYQSNCFQ